MFSILRKFITSMNSDEEFINKVTCKMSTREFGDLRCKIKKLCKPCDKCKLGDKNVVCCEGCPISAYNIFGIDYTLDKYGEPTEKITIIAQFFENDKYDDDNEDGSIIWTKKFI